MARPDREGGFDQATPLEAYRGDTLALRVNSIGAEAAAKSRRMKPSSRSAVKTKSWASSR